MGFRIAYISSTFPDFTGCGTGIYAGYLTHALSELNHDIHVITTALPEIKNTFGRVNMHKVMAGWGMTDAPRLIQTLMQIRPDIIHVNHPTVLAGRKSNFLVNFLPEINQASLRRPFVTTLHEFGQVSLLGKMKLMPLLLGSDVITVTNKHYKSQVKNYLEKFGPSLRESKIETVDVGSNFDTSFKDDFSFSGKTEERERWGLTPQDKVLGFFGFITRPKGFHHLLEILADLVKADPNYKLLALTSWNLTPPEYKHDLLSRIQALGLDGHIIFSGFLADQELWMALRAIDLCVFPFDYPIEERSSGVLRQALYKGLPVITYARDLNYTEGGLKHGENILLTPFLNKIKMAQEIIQFFNQANEKITDINRTSSSFAHRMREEALKLRPRLTFEYVANEMSRIYSKLL